MGSLVLLVQAAAQGAVDASAQDDRDAVAAPGAAGADGAEHDEVRLV